MSLGFSPVFNKSGGLMAPPAPQPAPPLSQSMNSILSVSVSNAAMAAAAAAAANSHHMELPPPPPAALMAASAAAGWPYPHPLTPLDPQTESWADNWRQFQQAAWAYNLDPSVLALYHGAGSAMDGPRRKNATRETTSMLKAWLNEHRKNPYPTKGEKIMLAIITKMTLTQVSTWFANARRRLKKENKMTWAPRNRSEEERAVGGNGFTTDEANTSREEDEEDDLDELQVEEEDDDEDEDLSEVGFSNEIEDDMELLQKKPRLSLTSVQSPHRIKQSVCSASTKPKIWSLVDTATTNTSPQPQARTPEATQTLTLPSLPPLSSSNDMSFHKMQQSLSPGALMRFYGLPLLPSQASQFVQSLPKGFFGLSGLSGPLLHNAFLPTPSTPGTPNNALQYPIFMPPCPPLGLQSFNGGFHRQASCLPLYDSSNSGLPSRPGSRS